MNEIKVTEIFSDLSEEVEDLTLTKQPKPFEVNPSKNFARQDFECSQLNFENSHKSILETSNPIFLNEEQKNKPFELKHTLGKKNIKNEIMKNSDMEKIIKNHKEPIFLGRLFLVKKFLKNLRDSTSFRTAKWLKSFQYELINDWVSFPPEKVSQNKFCMNNYLKKTLISIFFCGFELIIKRNFYENGKFKSFILFPTSNFRLVWDLMMIIVTIYNFVMIPLKVAFEKQLFLENFDIFGFFSFYIFLLDIVMNLNTAYYSKGELIISRKSIFLNYTLKGLIFFDLASILFLFVSDFLYFSSSLQGKLSALLFLFRLRNLSKTVSRFEEFLFSDETTNNMIGFIRLIFIIFLFSHWCACFYLLLGKSELPYGWTVIYNVSTSNMMTQYVSALYFIVVVMNTVGFGDMVANTLTERVFIICFIMIASIVFAYTINQIGTILYNINRNERELKKTMNLINGYMKAKNINFHLKVKIRNYLEYLWHTEKNQNSNETSDVINKLSKNLKDELLLNANGVVLKDVPLLTNNFSEETLTKLVYELKEINLTPGEIIYHQNDTNNLNCYIIKDGEIGLFLETNRTNIDKPTFLKVHKKGGYFGEFSFFSGFSRQTSSKSLSFSSLFVINHESFIRILKEVPEDYEKYCFIKHQINFSTDYSELKRKCYSCDTPNHTELNCPKLHLILSKERVLEKYNFSIPQRRATFERNPKKIRFNALINYTFFQRKASKITKTIYELETKENNEVEDSLDEIDNEESDKGTPLLNEFPLNRENCEFNPKKEANSPEGTNQKIEDFLLVDTRNEHFGVDTMKKNDEKMKSDNGIIISSMISDDHGNKVKSERQMMSGTALTSVVKEEEKNIIFDHFKSYAVFFPKYNIEDIIEKIHQVSQKKHHNKKSFYMQTKATSIFLNPRLSIKKSPRKEMLNFFSKISKFNKTMEENEIKKSKVTRISEKIHKFTFSIKKVLGNIWSQRK